MWWALGINVGLLLAEAIGGVLTGSLALLADAGHVLSDAGSIVLALIAARLALLPAAGRRTFGYQRSEVLAALVNGLLLVAVSVAIGIAAIGRFSDPPGIDGAGVFVLAGGSDIVDPIVGLLISVLVLFSSWRLIKEPIDVLMESAPADLDV